MSLFVDVEKTLGSFTLRVKLETTGGTTALLGASGSGKSVALQCIAGIMTADRGKIVLDGETLFDSEKHVNLPPQQRKIGYLFQNYALFPNMTVLQNVACGIRSGSCSEKRQSAGKLLQKFRLQGLENKYPAQLSGGEQQRTALARIVASEPKAILLDEPLSALDSYLRWELERELREHLSGFSGEILWVTHDLGECRRNCESVCVLHDGKSGALTEIQTLFSNPPDLQTAKLLGIRNFVQAYRTEHGLRLLEHDGKNGEECIVAIPTDAVLLGNSGAETTVLHVISDMTGNVAVLNAPQAQLLYAAVPDGMTVMKGQRVFYRIDTDRCFCYPTE